jgi:hypothetical protein
LGLRFPREAHEAEKEIGAFLRPDLRHYKARHDRDLMLPAGFAVVARAYEAARMACRGDTAAGPLFDSVRAELAQIDGSCGPLLSELHRLNEINRDYGRVSRRLDDVMNSRSWRAMGPIRLVTSGLRRMFAPRATRTSR